MHKRRFTEEQIISFLREQEQGQSTVEVCRRHANSPAQFGLAWERTPSA